LAGIENLKALPTLRILLTLLTLLTLVFSIASNAASEHTLHVGHVWARATPPGASVGAAYFVLHNAGHEHDRLLAIESTVARTAQMHTSELTGEMMKMKRLDGVDVDSGKSVEFAPGGHHVMLVGLHGPLTEGDSFTMTLSFDKAGPVTVDVKILGAGAMTSQHSHTSDEHAEHGGGTDADETTD
jgi:copper(I)-binding protein